MFREREPLPEEMGAENSPPATESGRQKPDKLGGFRKKLISGALVGASLFGMGGTAAAQEGGVGQENKTTTKIELQEQESGKLFGFGNLLKETRKYFLDRMNLDKQEAAEEHLFQLQLKYGSPAVEFAQEIVGEEIRINADPKGEEAKKLKLKHEFIDKILGSRELSEALLDDVDLNTMEPKEGRGNVTMRININGKEIEVLVVFGYGRLPDGLKEDEAAGHILRHKAAQVAANLELAQLSREETRHRWQEEGYDGWSTYPGSDGRGNDFRFSTSFRNERVGNGHGSYFVFVAGNYNKKII